MLSRPAAGVRLTTIFTHGESSSCAGLWVELGVRRWTTNF